MVMTQEILTEKCRKRGGRVVSSASLQQMILFKSASSTSTFPSNGVMTSRSERQYIVKSNVKLLADVVMKIKGKIAFDHESLCIARHYPSELIIFHYRPNLWSCRGVCG